MQSPNNSHAVAAPLGDDPSRRRFLAAGSAVTVFASLRNAIAQAEGGNARAVAASESDPVFAAVAAWESAMQAVDDARFDHSTWEARVRDWFARNYRRVQGRADDAGRGAGSPRLRWREHEFYDDGKRKAPAQSFGLSRS